MTILYILGIFLAFVLATAYILFMVYVMARLRFIAALHTREEEQAALSNAIQGAIKASLQDTLEETPTPSEKVS